MAPQPSLSSTRTQFFPPAPTFTSADIPDKLHGKTYIVTGATTGMGKQLAQAIADLESSSSSGQLHFLPLDLADLTSVKRAAEQFLSTNSKLNLLFNNAGVMPGPGVAMEKTVQGHELSLGVNCVGAFLLTQLLMPALETAAASQPTSSVRVIWLSSYGLGMYAPESRGIDMQNLQYSTPKDGLERYGISKCGDWLLAVEFGRRHPTVLNIPINPGNVASDLTRNQSWLLRAFGSLIFYPTLHGVYTQLFAGFSQELRPEEFDSTKSWVIPWGRVAPLRPDLPAATIQTESGGTGNAKDFWEWNREQVKDYL